MYDATTGFNIGQLALAGAQNGETMSLTSGTVSLTLLVSLRGCRRRWTILREIAKDGGATTD